MLWMETDIVRDRVNNLTATEAILTNAAILAALSKKGGEHFNDLIRRLREG
jgi:hypothetical protein